MSVQVGSGVEGTYYDAQYFKLQELLKVVRSTVEDRIRVAGVYAHQITGRVKSRESFVRKATKLLPDGSPKYEDPVAQITDLIGVRVVVPLASDVAAVAAPIRAAFDLIEEADRGNEAHVDRPGYQSLHLVVRLRGDAPELLSQPMLGTDTAIEIQIRSILQDALASFEHDLAYKAERAPTATTRRRLVELASLLHVADRLFSEVRNEALAEAEAADLNPDPLGTPESPNWPEPALERLLQQVVGEGEADPLPWLKELGRVLDALGYHEPGDLKELTPRLSGGRQLAKRLRKDRPWLAATQVLDLLLRAELGDRYFDRRIDSTEPRAVQAARAAFARDLQLVLDLRQQPA